MKVLLRMFNTMEIVYMDSSFEEDTDVLGGPRCLQER